MCKCVYDLELHANECMYTHVCVHVCVQVCTLEANVDVCMCIHMDVLLCVHVFDTLK